MSNEGMGFSIVWWLMWDWGREAQYSCQAAECLPRLLDWMRTHACMPGLAACMTAPTPEEDMLSQALPVDAATRFGWPLRWTASNAR